MRPVYTPMERRLLFIHSKDDRNQDCQAVVPAHPAILGLPNDVLTDEAIARDALSTARDQYETLAGGYIMALEAQGDHIDPSLKQELEEYRRFNDGWSFEFQPYNRVLAMKWTTHRKDRHEMGMMSPVLVSNDARTRPGPMAKPVDWEMDLNVMLIYNTTMDPDFALLPKEVMLEYECDLPYIDLVRKVDEDGWLAEVAMNAFCSSYTSNMPQALLLRDWAVEYNNRLLEKV